MFTLFKRKTVIPVVIATTPDPLSTLPNTLPDTLPPPDNVTVAVASETKYRPTGNRTFFLWILGGTGSYSFTFSRDGRVVKAVTAATNDKGLAMIEHNLIPGDYTVVATDTAGKSSTPKTVSVQHSEADLTILESTLSGASVSILLDAGRANLGPYKINVFKQSGEYLTTVAAIGTNPIQANLGIGPGTYYLQAVERMGYWSNMIQISYQTAATLNGSQTSTDEEFNWVSITLPSADELLEEEEIGIKPRLAQYGRLDDLNPLFSGLPGNWKVSDASTLSLPDGYSWVYFVGTDRIVTRTPLKDYPIEHNNPYKIIKMKLRNGVDSFQKWDIQGKAPGEDGYSVWNDRTAGDLFDRGDVGSCVSVIVL